MFRGTEGSRCCTQRSGALTNQLRQRLGWTKYEDYNVLAPFVDVCWWKLHSLVRWIISTYINHKHQWYIYISVVINIDYELSQTSTIKQISVVISHKHQWNAKNCFQQISRKSIFYHHNRLGDTELHPRKNHHPQMCRILIWKSGTCLIQGQDSPAAFGRPLLMPQVSSDGLAM